MSARRFAKAHPCLQRGAEAAPDVVVPMVPGYITRVAIIAFPMVRGAQHRIMPHHRVYADLVARERQRKDEVLLDA